MSGIDLAEERMWLGLLEGTRLALATLSVDDLEALADHAERTFGRMQAGSRINIARDVMIQHGLLGDLLQETAVNISVLQRLRDARETTQWEA